MLRRLTAAALILLVQSGALTAPLTHVHLDDVATTHHDGRSQHAHLSGHHAALPIHSGPVVDHQEEAGRTVTSQIYVAGAGRPFSLPALSSAVFALVVPLGMSVPAVMRTFHGLAPPIVSQLPPRAPPAFLS